MRYTQPRILSTLKAASAIQSGVEKGQSLGDHPGETPDNRLTSAAYESDE
jgi:hypothetical protein